MAWYRAVGGESEGDGDELTGERLSDLGKIPYPLSK